jgi:Icc-related predicted phosphoesterase
MSKKVPLFLAGDIGHVSKPLYAEFLAHVAYNWEHVFLINGNHEYDGCKSIEDFQEIDEKTSQLVSRIGNITFLNQSATLFKGHLIIGCTLWTKTPIVEKLKDRVRIENSFHEKHRQFINNTLYNARETPCIVMSHHVPSYELVSPSPLFGKILFRWASHSDYLIRKPARVWICGHNHASFVKDINGVKVILNAGPRRGIREFK